jgi:Zn-dependent protease with chaperone function
VPAATTFFEHQHLARRNTRVMVVLFLIAMVAVVIAVDFVLATAYLWGIADSSTATGKQPGMLTLYRLVPGQIYLGGAVLTAGIILAVSAVNIVKLAGGGSAVAEMIGARRLAPGTRDALERRLLNVVEEMAIAAGVRVPAVYVMDDERGINAFAAGYDVSNSVVTVTRGTLETLTRDELQGVIGHEFSHILNGDMRLNIRMIGVLAGIVFIGSIGHFVMRSVRDSDSRNTGGIFVLGLALFIIGYVGLFFARLIKAAVSRQREFLADASSVQFTRNPEGIAGALDQIGRATGLISNRYAEELAHMFFGQSIKVWLGGLFDTHPPLEERIRRVYPGFQPTSYRNKREMAAPPSAVGGEAAFGRVAGFAGSSAAPAADGRRSADISAAWGRSAGESAALVGTMDSAKVDYAVRLLGSLPVPLREGLRETESALAIVVSLLFAPKDGVMAQQLEALQGAALGKLAGGAKAVAPLTRRLAPAFHLPVLDLALPALKLASEAEKSDLVKALRTMIHADRRVSLHEFVVLTLVRHQLAPRKGAGAVTSKKLADLRPEVLSVLGLLAHAGVRADATGERERQLLEAMRAGMKAMGLDGEPERPPELAIDDAIKALGALRRLAPLQKAIVVKGLFAAVSVDGSIRVAEAELMRLVGAVLDCPLPPLLESLDPATLAA